MKKTLLLAAMLIMGLSMMAQETTSSHFTPKQILEQVTAANQAARGNFRLVLDSVTYLSEWQNFTDVYEYDWKGRKTSQTTNGEHRFVLTYNDNDLLISQESYFYEEAINEWLFEDIFNYTYDDNNNLILFDYNAMRNGEVAPIERCVYTYDEQNRVTSWIDYHNSSNESEPDFQPSMKDEFAYHDNVVETYYYFTDPWSHAWVPSGWLTEEFRDDGNYISSITRNWDNNLNEYVNSNMVVHEYNPDGSIAVITSSNWETNSNAWVVMNRLTTKFNDQNQLTQAFIDDRSWETGELLPTRVYEYEYDGSGNRYLRKEYSYDNNGELILDRTYECNFDESVDATKIMGCKEVYFDYISMGFASDSDIDYDIYSKWDMYTETDYTRGITTVAHAYYSAASSVDDNGAVYYSHIYGTEGKVVINNDKAVAVSIYDLTGRQVAVRPSTITCEINLTAGIYVVKAGDAVVKVVVR